MLSNDSREEVPLKSSVSSRAWGAGLERTLGSRASPDVLASSDLRLQHRGTLRARSPTEKQQAAGGALSSKPARGRGNVSHQNKPWGFPYIHSAFMDTNTCPEGCGEAQGNKWGIGTCLPIGRASHSWRVQLPGHFHTTLISPSLLWPPGGNSPELTTCTLTLRSHQGHVAVGKSLTLNSLTCEMKGGSGFRHRHPSCQGRGCKHSL